MSQPDPTQLPAGAVLDGRYRVLRALAEGGAGTLYEVEHVSTKARAALKLLRRFEPHDAEQTRRLLGRARSTPRSQHAHAVTVLDVGEAPEGVFVVYELLEAFRELPDRMRERGAFPLAEALAVMLPVMRALAASHALGVVHRDLRPASVVLVETPVGVVAKVRDTGIEDAIVGRLDPLNPRPTMLVGNPRYKAPEQLTGEAVDARVDVWSCGVMIYELLSGETPFDSMNVTRLVVEIVQCTPRSLAARVPSLPPPLVEAVHRALTPRDRRYPTMQAFLDALTAVT